MALTVLAINLATAAVPGSPAVIDFIYPTLSLITVGLLGYIARNVTRAVRKFRGEHEWLMEQTSANTEAIKTMLEQRAAEDRREQAKRPAARRPART